MDKATRSLLIGLGIGTAASIVLGLAFVGVTELFDAPYSYEIICGPAK